jgi:hypothetical protein
MCSDTLSFLSLLTKSNITLGVIPGTPFIHTSHPKPIPIRHRTRMSVIPSNTGFLANTKLSSLILQPLIISIIGPKSGQNISMSLIVMVLFRSVVAKSWKNFSMEKFCHSMEWQSQSMEWQKKFTKKILQY